MIKRTEIYTMMKRNQNSQPILNILLVEDNPGDVILVKEHLKDSGIKYELTHSGNLTDALKKCSENSYDAILLDLGLPESSGLETLKKFPLSTIETPVIVMTGLDDEETAIQALQEGAQDYMVKSNMSREDIVRSVRYSIERKKIQEVQKKIALQFSTLASTTALINESSDASSIYRICSDSIKFLLGEQQVFFIEYLDHTNPYTNYYEWLESFFNQVGKINGIDFYQANMKMIGRIQEMLNKIKDQNVIEIKGGVREMLSGDYNHQEREKIHELLEAEKIYLLGFSRENRRFGGIFILSKKQVNPDDLNILEVIANQASLGIHRRNIEKDLMISEQRYRMLNKKLEERVLERTKDLARTNALLEEELEVRVRLEQELVQARDELEIRVKERTAQLEISETRFHNMFSGHEAIMWLVDPETGIIVEANRSAKQFYGHDFDDSQPVKIQHLNIAAKDKILNKLADAVNMKNNYLIAEHTLASGDKRTVEIYTSPIEINNEILLFFIIHDITERKQMEEALKESESLYKSVVNNSLNLILISIDGTIEFANDAASEFSRIPVNDIIGKRLDNLFTPSLIEADSEQSVNKIIYEAVLENRAVEIQVRNNKGASYNFLVRGITIKYKAKNAVLYIFTDITESKNVEQFVLNKIIDTEENDRKRFASDLHDDLGPLLSAVKLRLGLMEKTGNMDELKENAAISDEIMGIVIEKVRSLSQTISPNLLDNLGLDAAVRDLCKRVLMQNKISFEFESEIENQRFSQPVEIHFYRIISELINNSLKHAEASLIHINLRCVNDSLKLVYYDNGKGYTLQDSFRKESGIGLRSILNRVNLISGTIDFKQDKGLTVVKISKKLDTVASEFNPYEN